MLAIKQRLDSNDERGQFLLAGEPPDVQDAPIGVGAHAERIVAGGYPDVQQRSAAGRTRFFASYISTLLGRDLPDIARVRDSDSIERLLRLIAARSASLVSARAVATELGADHRPVVRVMS